MMISEASPIQERNKRIVEIYFKALDQGDLFALDQLFSGDCLIHRPGVIEPLRGIEGISSVVKGAAERYRSLSTKINAMLAEENLVACRLTHRAEFARPWDTRIGTFDVSNRVVIWHPLVLFSMKMGKIVEQWVCRDDLGMLIDLGALTAVTHQPPP